jgi:hypothetical protein
MIIGAHSIIYSRNASKDREFLSKIIGLPSVDAGEGWLIFGLPPSEAAIHPAERKGRHEFYLLCDEIHDFVNEMIQRKVRTGKIQRQRWGYLVEITMPGGGKLGVYQPLHKRPEQAKLRKVRRNS